MFLRSCEKPNLQIVRLPFGDFSYSASEQISHSVIWISRQCELCFNWLLTSDFTLEVGIFSIYYASVSRFHQYRDVIRRESSETDINEKRADQSRIWMQHYSLFNL